jgi:hypothetical protein
MHEHLWADSSPRPSTTGLAQWPKWPPVGPCQWRDMGVPTRWSSWPGQPRWHDCRGLAGGGLSTRSSSTTPGMCGGGFSVWYSSTAPGLCEESARQGHGVRVSPRRPGIDGVANGGGVVRLDGGEGVTVGGDCSCELPVRGRGVRVAGQLVIHSTGGWSPPKRRWWHHSERLPAKRTGLQRFGGGYKARSGEVGARA